MNPVLAAGQLIVSIALTFAVLLQSRGSGLGGTFGGDSAVYRSRRGIERRLWQFTIVLIVLFSMFSLAAYVLTPVRLTRHGRTIRAPTSGRAVDQPPGPRRRGRPEHRARRPVGRRAGRLRSAPPTAGGAHAGDIPRPAATWRACSVGRRTRVPSALGPRRIARWLRCCSGASSAWVRAARSSATSRAAGTSAAIGPAWTFHLREGLVLAGRRAADGR